MDNATVKLDSILLGRVKRLIKRDSCRIRYGSLKQFVNIAVLNLLELEIKDGSKTGPNGGKDG
jgi:hypothetical protein